MSAAFKHNYRIEFADNVNPEMEVYNQELVPMSHDTYNETYKAHTQNLGYGIDKDYRKNGVLALEIMLSFSREALPNINIENWKEDNLNWLRTTFNICPERYGDNVMSAVYHADESTAHIHAIIIPIDEKGRLNAYKYLNGPQGLRELQTTYAKAMEPHGLERGMELSPAKHADIKKLYGQLNKALNVDIPKWEEKDTAETYQEKVREYTKEKVAVFLKQMNDKERELAKAKAVPTVDTKVLEKKLNMANRKIRKYEEKEREFEQKYGSMESAKRILDSVKLLEKGLDDMDVEAANEFRDQLNDIVRRQRKKERDKKAKDPLIYV